MQVQVCKTQDSRAPAEHAAVGLASLTWTSTSKDTCGLEALLCHVAPPRLPSASELPSPCVVEEDESLLLLDSVATDAGEAGLVRGKLLSLRVCPFDPREKNAATDRMICFPFEEGGLRSAFVQEVLDMLLLRFICPVLLLLLLPLSVLS